MPGIVGTAVPETQYALNGDVHLAYQTLGEGPPDILSVIAVLAAAGFLEVYATPQGI